MFFVRVFTVTKQQKFITGEKYTGNSEIIFACLDQVLCAVINLLSKVTKLFSTFVDISKKPS